MSRIYNPDNAGKLRNQLTRSVVLAIRELMKQPDTTDETRDLAAFIAISLIEIGKTVETSVLAWEKKGYWVKSDRFRMDWEWSDLLGKKMLSALRDDDWTKVALTAVQVGQKLNKVTIPERNRIGTPWVGAWDHLMDY